MKNEGRNDQEQAKYFIDDDFTGINLKKLLLEINKRIEKLLDQDHCIGHSYFMSVSNIDALKHVFANKILPLLEEYFYGDFGKIGLVLGESFIEKNEDKAVFATFAGYDDDVKTDLAVKAIFKIKPQEDWNFNSIYE